MKCVNNTISCNHETGLDEPEWLCKCCSESYSPKWNEKLPCPENNMQSSINIPREFAEELNNDLPELMCHYSYNPNGSNYVCNFCGERPITNYAPIIHDDICIGIKLQNILSEQLE